MRGHMTIEAVLVVLIFFLILELWVSVQLHWPISLYQFLEGDTPCDIDCLLERD